MKSRLTILAERFGEARSDLDGARRETRQASARRLATLQALTDGKTLIAGLKDPSLTAQDREQLARTIAARLPRRRLRIPKSISSTALLALRQARYRWRGLVVAAVIAMPIAAFLLLSAHNTGEQRVWFDTDVVLNFNFLDGHVEPISFTAGSLIVVMARPPGLIRLRYWTADYGYGTATVNEQWFALHARR
ncbi:MAG: hypothetical protein JWO45_1963 [Spartobacteria bacterium]|nr:hypothetical protein [Spartobacteria bacterium]